MVRKLDAISRAAERHGVAELALFGSAVRGGLAAHSDVDFLVDFSTDRADPFEDFSDLRRELCGTVGREVDLVVKRAIRNPSFRDSALAQAATAYAVKI